MASAAATGISAAVTLVQAIATGTATAAQWQLNAAMLACPLTWIVVAVVAVIAALVALGVWIHNLWQNNIDFRIGVISEWNKVLNFIDAAPVFFAGVGVAIADKFSETKEMVLLTLEDLVNGAIDRINRLIEFANRIPGVSIDIIDNVSFGTEAAIAEQAEREARNAKLAAAQMTVAARAAERANKLQTDAAGWRAEAAAKQEAEQAAAADDTAFSDWVSGNSTATPSVQVSGGSVDISRESLEYLNDIAEVQVLESVQSSVGLRLSREDADLMQAAANANYNNFYIQYQSKGVNVQNDIHKGDSLEDVFREIERRTQDEIDAGMSNLEDVVFG